MIWPLPDPATVLAGDCRALLAALPAGVVQTCFTSPPYWGLRSYSTEPQVWGGDPACDHAWRAQKRAARHNDDGVTGSTLQGGKTTQTQAQRTETTDATCTRCNAWRGEYGSEPTVDLYVAHTVEVFRAVRRVLRPDGTLWLNIGDAYTGSGPTGTGRRADGGIPRGIKLERTKRSDLGEKQLLLLPARVALALQADGWVLRDDIAWVKAWQNEAMDLDGSAMPGSQQDRLTPAWEHIYLFSPRPHYYFDREAVKALSGANARNVFRINPRAYPGAHFATFPPALVRLGLLAGTSARGQCPACGAPWRRVVERESYRTDNGPPPTRKHEILQPGNTSQFRPEHDIRGGIYSSTTTTGWAPTCRCEAGEPIPQLVLDPFAGSGTTLAVARSLGRHAVGCELNPAYIALALERIAAATPWYAAGAPAAHADGWGDLPLFAEAPV